MNTVCARCNKKLVIDCPLCYIAKIDNKYFCNECYWIAKNKVKIKTAIENDKEK